MHTSKSQLMTICLIKVAYAFFAVFIFARFSSLGDTQDYLQGEYIERNNLASTAYLMSMIGTTLGVVGSFVFSLAMSLWGIIYLLEKARFSLMHSRIVIFLMILPSFGVWTSILSKEVFVLFSFCLCTGGLIELLMGRRFIFSLFQLVGLALLTFIKPHYSLCIYLSIAAIMLNRSGFRRELLLAITLLFFLVAAVLSFLNVEVIYQNTQALPAHFSLQGGTTRINDFWIDEYDFFTYLPVGLPLAFIGPSFTEALSSIKLLPFFIEGCLLFGFVAVNGWRAVFYRHYINVLGVVLMLTFCLALLLTHYPFGLFNPGSAVRYRSGFILPLCIFVLYLATLNRSVRGG